MGLIAGIMGVLFGSSRNVLLETLQVIRSGAASECPQQIVAGYVHRGQGIFDRAVDALNRLPRPMLALGTIWFFVMAMVDPVGFATGMAGLALVPEPLWWLMAAIVSFYFGARHQAKEQDFRRVLAAAVAGHPAAAPDDPVPDGNQAIADWQRADGA